MPTPATTPARAPVLVRDVLEFCGDKGILITYPLHGVARHAVGNVVLRGRATGVCLVRQAFVVVDAAVVHYRLRLRVREQLRQPAVGH